MKKEKQMEFDAVAFMRKRRNEMSELFAEDEKKFWKELETIRKKYKDKFHQRLKHSA